MKWTSVLLAGFLLALGLVFSHCGDGERMIDTVATPISATVDQMQIPGSYYKKKVALKTSVFYRANGYGYAWLAKRRPDKLFEALIEEVRSSEAYGFIPEDYRIDELEQAVNALYEDKDRTASDISNLDIRITASFFLFSTHLLEGRIRYPGAKEFVWKKGMPLENDIALLLKMESTSDLRKELEGLHPQESQYARLKKALRQYRAVERADTLEPLPARLRVKVGDAHERIPAVRAKLALMGDLQQEDGSSTVFDEWLAEALKRFQTRHQLAADGQLNGETIALLNIPLRRKAEIIALNMERMRWRPHLVTDDAVVINVPEYMLRVFERNREKMTMRVVLGSEYTPTPVFFDTLSYLVFSPTWRVPESIFGKEFLPMLQEDPLKLDIERFRLYKDGKIIDPLEEVWTDKDLDTSRYTLVEDPGDANSLGKVKFIMPNDFSVYLHDTPADKLFSREKRALSHGCIRLERPVDLAVYLLRDQKGWSEKKIKDAMQSEEPVKVNLKNPYPVYIIYRTVWVDDHGTIRFLKDIYGHDHRQLERLPLAAS